MKPKLALFGGAICALLLGALLFANHQRQLAPAYILAHYPQTVMFESTADRHLLGDGLGVAFETHWFDDTKTDFDTVTGCQIGTDLSKTCGTTDVGVALRPLVPVNKSQLAAFDKIAPTLPSGVSKPPIENLLIVSFGGVPKMEQLNFSECPSAPIARVACAKTKRV